MIRTSMSSTTHKEPCSFVRSLDDIFRRRFALHGGEVFSNVFIPNCMNKDKHVYRHVQAISMNFVLKHSSTVYGMIESIFT